MVKPSRNLRGIKRYEAVDTIRKIDFSRPFFKLDWNESTIPPSPKVIEAIIGFLRREQRLNLYPDPGMPGLKQALSRHLKASKESILVTNGSAASFELLCNAYLDPGDNVIVVMPTYSNFVNWPKIHGAKIIKAGTGISKPAVREIIRKAGKSTKMIYLINPYIFDFSQKEISLIARSSRNSLLVIDEAYSDFWNSTSIGLIKKNSNIVVLRSFSKAFSIAGLRLGYIVASPKVIGTLSLIHNFVSVNILAQIAGVAALKDSRRIKRYASEVRKSVSLLCNELPKLGFEAIPSNAGLVLFRHKSIRKEKLKQILKENNIFVRKVGEWYGNFSKDYLRMNVGTVGQTKSLIALFKKLFSEKV